MEFLPFIINEQKKALNLKTLNPSCFNISILSLFMAGLGSGLYTFCLVSYSAGQVGVPALVRAEPCRACAAERRIRHRQSSSVRLPGPTDPAEDPSGQAIFCPSARRGASGSAWIRLDARGLRQGLHSSGKS